MTETGYRPRPVRRLVRAAVASNLVVLAFTVLRPDVVVWLPAWGWIAAVEACLGSFLLAAYLDERRAALRSFDECSSRDAFVRVSRSMTRAERYEHVAALVRKQERHRLVSLPTRRGT